ncbi:hypothetical protein [Streptomyces sp. NPDC056987]|uniref:hypothetical protein n=1 Tax=Streptomyces sp. NPDC056987 TaxID=3345988 RepID=UPI00363FF383
MLFLNPGGPRLPERAAPITLTLPQKILDSYDVIGFDPQGIGESAPLTCDLTPEQNTVTTIPFVPCTARPRRRGRR